MILLADGILSTVVKRTSSTADSAFSSYWQECDIIISGRLSPEAVPADVALHSLQVGHCLLAAGGLEHPLIPGACKCTRLLSGSMDTAGHAACQEDLAYMGNRCQVHKQMGLRTA